MDIFVDRNLKAAEFMLQGNIDEAITLLEANIAEGFDGNGPYDRLADIYNKRKQYDDEKRVLRKAIEVFTQLSKTSQRRDVPVKLERFIERYNKINK